MGAFLKNRPHTPKKTFIDEFYCILRKFSQFANELTVLEQKSNLMYKYNAWIFTSKLQNTILWDCISKIYFD